jgi:hypothetical protein
LVPKSRIKRNDRVGKANSRPSRALVAGAPLLRQFGGQFAHRAGPSSNVDFPAMLRRFLDAGHPIEAYCVVCEDLWSITAAERVAIAKKVRG